MSVLSVVALIVSSMCMRKGKINASTQKATIAVLVVMSAFSIVGMANLFSNIGLGTVILALTILLFFCSSTYLLSVMLYRLVYRHSAMYHKAIPERSRIVTIVTIVALFAAIFIPAGLFILIDFGWSLITIAGVWFICVLCTHLPLFISALRRTKDKDVKTKRWLIISFVLPIIGSLCALYALKRK